MIEAKVYVVDNYISSCRKPALFVRFDPYAAAFDALQHAFIRRIAKILDKRGEKKQY
jgi:hypothetical protein